MASKCKCVDGVCSGCGAATRVVESALYPARPLCAACFVDAPRPTEAMVMRAYAGADPYTLPVEVLS